MTAIAPAEVGGREDSAIDRARATPRWLQATVIVALWVVAYQLWKGIDTLPLDGLSKTGVHDSLSGWRDDLIANRDTNVLMQTTGWLAEQFSAMTTWLQELISTPPPGRPVPQIGWLGVVALAGWVGYLMAGWRIALLAVASFLSFGLLGYWEDTMDTLLLTLLAVVICVLIGLPLAVLMARSKAVTAALNPVLDVLQTSPSFNYLVPLFLFFGLGAPCGVAASVLYATAPVVRISAHAIRSVSGTTVEATDSMGQTSWQRLRKVELPMAKSTIIVGINQTMMAALSMVIIAAFVDAPGLGGPVLQALAAQQIGDAFVAGLCIVILAILLDRATTAASVRSENLARKGGTGRSTQDWVALAVGAVVVAVCVYYSRLYSYLAEFEWTTPGDRLSDWVQDFTGWFTSTFDTVTTGAKDAITAAVLNPMQSLLAESPWYVSGAAISLLALAIAGLRAFVITVACLAGIYWLDLWHDAMITLNMTLVGALLVMVLALVIGVWMARSPRVDLVLRPILDAAQVMPPFVYLIPAIFLFEVGRFSAIIAGVIYAAPIAIKLVADGVQRVSTATVEAAESTGATSWQMITKVQLPMARGSIVLAANQGLLYVLSMAVIGGLVGAGALGYDSVLGFSQAEFYGKGLAAAGAIVLLGIMVDRIARQAAERSGEETNILTKTRGPGAGV